MRIFVSGLALAAALAGLGTGPAAAQDNPQVTKLFTALDKDKNSDLSLEEFTAPVKTRIVQADADKDGRATAAEFAAAKKIPEAAAKRLLASFDTDKDGAVALAEVESRRSERFKVLDADADGKLTLAEFQAPRAMAGKGDKPKSTTP